MLFYQDIFVCVRTNIGKALGEGLLNLSEISLLFESLFKTLLFYQGSFVCVRTIIGKAFGEGLLNLSEISLLVECLFKILLFYQDILVCVRAGVRFRCEWVERCDSTVGTPTCYR